MEILTPTIVIDAGNTRIKCALIENEEVKEFQVFTIDETEKLHAFITSQSNIPVFVSSVLSDQKNGELFGECNVRFLDPLAKSPFINTYTSASTLGNDRMCNAAFAIKKRKGKNTVTIDFGTCIKFDFVNDKSEYCGGSISPGLEMRYKALHHFTGKLPLLQPEETNLVGASTAQSIHSGIINGIQGEINHMINRYASDYKDLTFFVTGGDSKYFEFPLKSNIFAVENLTLLGLFYLYQLNA